MTTAAAALEKRKRLRRNLFLSVTVLISLACLIWSLNDIDWGQFREEVRELHWAWVLAAILADIAVYVWQGWRWSLLLHPIAPVTMWQCVRAIYVGLYANEILPLRTGELIRCFLVTRWTELPFSVTLSSALIERIFDGIWLIACLLVTVRFVDLPRFLDGAGATLIVLILLAIIVLSFAMFQKHRVPLRLANSAAFRKLQILLDDLNILGHSRYLYGAGLASLPYLLMQILPIYAMFRAYDLDLGLGSAAVLMVILRLGAVVPQAPGNVGMFQTLAILALTQVLSVDVQVAKRFSFILWGVVTLPLLVAGFGAFAITGLKIRELRHEAQSGMSRPAES